MDILLIIIGSICLLAGLIGCIVPMLPGTPIAYMALVLLHFTDKVQFTTFIVATPRYSYSGTRLFYPDVRGKTVWWHQLG